MLLGILKRSASGKVISAVSKGPVPFTETGRPGVQAAPLLNGFAISSIYFLDVFCPDSKELLFCRAI